MTWDALHRRGDVLRAVVDESNTRRDGVLPMELPGVAEMFGDELTLIGALQLRWHTRLAGEIERELMDQSMEPEDAVTSAWRRTATELAGVRAILDSHAGAPTSEAMALALTAAHGKDWALMGAMAGMVTAQDDRAVEIGRDVERRARACPTALGGRHRSEGCEQEAHESLFGRLRSYLAA